MTPPLTWLDNWATVEPAREAIPLDLTTLNLTHLPAQERWANRLQQLAIQGFKRWLQEREPSLSCTRTGSLSAMTALLQVGDFRVCLIPTSLTEDEIAIPKAAIAHPDSAAHFYVAVAIDEEAEVASLVGFLSHDQLAPRCADLIADADETYPLPTTALNPEPNTLLLFLQCLVPSAIALPVAATSTQPERPSLIETMRQPLVNAGAWLQRQTNELLGGWEPVPAMGLRWQTSSVRDQLTAALKHNALPTLPTEAGIAYQTVPLADHTQRLFAAVWPWPNEPGNWALLVVVCPAPGQTFPPGLSLTIDEITPGTPRVELAHERLVGENQRSALFAQVKGNRHDVFDIVLTASGNAQPWSAAIQFQPEA